ncbi:MAG TPA: TetR/AcrR family transcriptional regulator [Chitinophagaceae bacterium]
MAKKKLDQTTEEKILAAARKVFIRDGMAGARMQDIADEAGMNKALLHYYFRNKEKLFETIFKEATIDFLPRMNAIFESDIPLFEKIEIFCREYIAQISKNPFIPLFLLSEMNKKPERFLNKMWGGQKIEVSKFAEQIQREVKKGTIKPIHPLHLIMNLFGMCVFPFIGKTMIHFMTGISQAQFDEMMEQRKSIIPAFIIDAIKK